MIPFRNGKKKDLLSHKTGLVFVYGKISKSRNPATFKKELFATAVGNGRKLQRASSYM